jgi:hypothetical protein
MVEIFDDIRKIYRFSGPCDELAPYIEFFSESAVTETAELAAGQAFEVKMFPSCTPTFWINLGTSYEVEQGNSLRLISPDEDIAVVRDRVITRHNQAEDYIFTVKFFPGGLEAILGFNQARMTGRIIPLYLLLPWKLIEEIKAVTGFEQRMERLQEFFLSSLEGQHTKDHYLHLVRDSMDAYLETGMRYNTTEVAEKMFVSSKTINRYFNHVVGIPPTMYGYYDMSHFYRDVVQFTGQKMKERR